jgi:N-hydroxyarylamine O-acetyltransferase
VDEARVDAYLARIGATRPVRPDAAALRELQERHLRTVPFENLSVHLGERIVLEPPALVAKLVDRQRGGFCYELNGAFAALLTALGYRVTMLAARVLLNPSRIGPLFDHVALRVEPPDADPPEVWLADVGFGDFSRHPLRLDERGDQLDPDGTFRVVALAYGDLEVLQDGVPQYRMEARPRQLADFEPTCWWQRTSPRSQFTRSIVCTRLTDTGRITISGRRLIRTEDGVREEQTLAGDAELLAAFQTHFGITLDRVPSFTRLASRATS